MKSNDNNENNIFLSLENHCTFLLDKEKTWKRIFNTNSELSENHAEKQIMPSKIAINWLFTNIWCYLLIASFDWKIVVFQQTVLRVYYILNSFVCSKKKNYLKKVDIVNLIEIIETSVGAIKYCLGIQSKRLRYTKTQIFFY